MSVRPNNRGKMMFLNHFPGFISCSYTISNAYANLPPEWVVHGSQQENQQTKDTREHHCHPEVHALAPHVKEPSHRDIDNSSDQ